MVVSPYFLGLAGPLDAGRARSARGCGSSARRRRGRPGASQPAARRSRTAAQRGLVEVVGRVDEHEVGRARGGRARRRGGSPTVERTTRTAGRPRSRTLRGDDVGRPAVGLDEHDGCRAAARRLEPEGTGPGVEVEHPRPPHGVAGVERREHAPRAPGRSSGGCPSPAACAACDRPATPAMIRVISRAPGRRPARRRPGPAPPRRARGARRARGRRRRGRRRPRAPPR